MLEHLRAVSWVVDPTRPNVLNEEEVPNELLDDAEWHLESVRDKELPVDEINAFNHMAIFLRWCIEHHLMVSTLWGLSPKTKRGREPSFAYGQSYVLPGQPSASP